MAGNLIFLGKGTSFNGTITAEEVVVEGAVEGEIRASDRILIKKGAVINGTIETQKLLFEEGGKHNGFVRLGSKRILNDEQTEGLPEPPTLDEQLSETEKPDEVAEPTPKKPSQKLW